MKYLNLCTENDYFRNHIKEACKIVGFTDPVVKSSRIGNNITNETFKKYERVSTHTARRSFITNMINQM